MTGPVDTSQDGPLDVPTYRHQLLLLKSAHCGRPVIHRGLSQFITGLTLYQSSTGSGVAMTVYMAGIREGVDSKDVQIKMNEI